MCTSSLSPYSLITVGTYLRFGMKVIEQPLEPLTKYMAILSKKLPHLRDVFVSTETMSTIADLIR